MSFFSIDADKCDANGACVEECPVYLLTQPNKNEPPIGIDGAEESCFNCGHCVSVCPSEALSYQGDKTGKSLRPDQLVPIDRRRYPSTDQVIHMVKSRRAIRNFSDKPIERDLLESVIEVARYAPSGLNLQDTEWSVLATREEVAALRDQIFDWMRDVVENQPDHWAAYSFPPILASWEEQGIDTPTHNAPALLVTHSPKDSVAAVSMATIAMTYAEVTAVSLGIDTCWVGLLMMALEQWKPLRDYLKVPDNNETHACMLLGYAKYNYRLQPTKKQPVIHWQT